MKKVLFPLNLSKLSKMSETENHTESDVADWMIEAASNNCLYQDDAVSEIEKKFGKEFVYDNENGNPAISKKVLAIFRKTSGENIVWSRSDRLWRERVKTDLPGRMQD